MRPAIYFNNQKSLHITFKEFISLNYSKMNDFYAPKIVLS